MSQADQGRHYSSGDGRLAERAAMRTDGSAPLSGVERWGTIIGGGMLMKWGLRHGGISGLLGLAAGGVMAWSGANGRLPKSLGSLAGNRHEGEIASRRGWSTTAAVSATVTVDRPAEELYRFWRDFSNLPKIMEHIEGIEVLDSRRSRWTVSAPAGSTVTWHSRVTEDEPNRRIAWESEPGADVRNAGWVEFRPAPAGRGTEVHALIVYEPPAGQIGRLVAKLFQEEPGVQMRQDLGRFKRLMEGGEHTTDERRPM